MAKTIKPIASVLGAAFLAASATPVLADANPFQASPLASGYDLVSKANAEGKCGEGKCGGDKAQSEGEKSKNKAKAKAEGKCGEGKCGGDKARAEGKKAKAEGKCGEGKCGAKEDAQK
jgi:uncharacterized low-complexity protein